MVLQVGFREEQLNAQPTTCQKSSARDHKLSLVAKGVSIFESSWSESVGVLWPELRRPPWRVNGVENLVNENAVCMSEPMGPTILFVRRRRRRAEVDWSCFSREVVRVVREGWMARVAARERWAGDGT